MPGWIIGIETMQPHHGWRPTQLSGRSAATDNVIAEDDCVGDGEGTREGTALPNSLPARHCRLGALAGHGGLSDLRVLSRMQSQHGSLDHHSASWSCTTRGVWWYGVGPLTVLSASTLGHEIVLVTTVTPAGTLAHDQERGELTDWLRIADQVRMHAITSLST